MKFDYGAKSITAGLVMVDVSGNQYAPFVRLEVKLL